MGNLTERSRTASIITGIVVVVAVAAGGFFGGQWLMQWHRQQLKTAIEQEQRQHAQERAELEEQIQQLEEAVEQQKPAPVTDKRMTEVFGASALQAESGVAGEPRPCELLNKNIQTFFAYLDKRGYANSQEPGKQRRAYDVFREMMDDLAVSPPLIVGETQDIVSLKHNQAHFYRVLEKDRLNMVLAVMRAEKDVLEHAMADFYQYYVAEECCRFQQWECLSMETWYQYAAFFLDTLSGRSYLFRRDSMIRALTRYYCVLILDKAIGEGINRYGLDIRPQLELALNEIRTQNNLLFQESYISRLQGLKVKYE